MKKLWQKNWNLDKKVEVFETESDLLLDQQLVKFDVLGSIAHAKGLEKIGLLSIDEVKTLSAELQEILELNEKNQFDLQFGDEDVHTKIENHLTAKLGEVGKKIHTGRSRNDQVLTALRLFIRENLFQIWFETLDLTESFLNFSKQHSAVLIPGYTHMQKAMPSTIGLWAGAFVEGLLDDLVLLKAAFQLNDQSPLGGAAGYGVPLPLDRQFTADLLGFTKVQNNSLYCQNSRGKIEGVVIAALISIIQDVNKFASDILLFTTSEFGFFEVTSELCSGSSIMPQKKNVDIAELLRSKVHLLLGNYVQIISLSTNLFSGYSRDLQDGKKPLFESLKLSIQVLQITKILLASLKINQQKIKSQISPELFATHYALNLVEQGIPFRQAYQKAATGYQKFDPNVDFSIKGSTHLGGIGNLGLDLAKKQLKSEQSIYQLTNKKYQEAIGKLLSQKVIYEK